jgi:hypothetical protein
LYQSARERAAAASTQLRTELQTLQELSKTQRAEIDTLQQKLNEAMANAQAAASNALTTKLEKELTGMLLTTFARAGPLHLSCLSLSVADLRARFTSLESDMRAKDQKKEESPPSESKDVVGLHDSLSVVPSPSYLTTFWWGSCFFRVAHQSL